MSLLSKPYKVTFNLLGLYFSQLYMNPVRTKSITSCILAALGNYISQKRSGNKLINQDSLWAFAIFGLLFGGSIPHYFYKIMSDFLDRNASMPLLQLFVIERLFFMPLYTFFSLYTLSRLEGKNSEYSLDNTYAVFPKIVSENLKYLSLFQYINIYFVPPFLRVLVANLISFFWVIYLSSLRKSKC